MGKNKKRLRFTLHKPQHAQEAVRKARKRIVIAIKIAEIIMGILTMGIILLHTRKYIFVFGMMLALTNFIVNLTILSMACAADFSRYLDVCCIIMLMVYYFATFCIWLCWYIIRDHRRFVLILIFLDVIAFILLLIDFLVHYTIMEKKSEKRKDMNN